MNSRSQVTFLFEINIISLGWQAASQTGTVLANGKGWYVCSFFFSPKRKICSNTDNLMCSTFLGVKAACYETGPNPSHSGPSASKYQTMKRRRVSGLKWLVLMHSQKPVPFCSSRGTTIQIQTCILVEAFSFSFIIWSCLSLGVKIYIYKYRKNIYLACIQKVKIGGSHLDRWIWEWCITDLFAGNYWCLLAYLFQWLGWKCGSAELLLTGPFQSLHRCDMTLPKGTQFHQNSGNFYSFFSWSSHD